jgi:F0F1-type ATP synthase assembly protein I
MSVTPSSQPPGGNSIWRHLYAGTSLALTILLFTFAGIWIDRHWNVKPFGTIGGAFFGIGMGLYNFIREFTQPSE